MAVRSRPRLVGVVNVTADSFSDGGRYLEPAVALEHARGLLAAGADIVELGPASSHPDAAKIPPEEEIRRLAPILDALLAEGLPVSIDSSEPETQRYGLRRGVPFLNDIAGFPDPELYPELARAPCLLFVMHTLRSAGRASRERIEPALALDSVHSFFEQRIARLVSAGIERSRLVLDPGMGFFLGGNAEPSLAVLRELPRIRAAFGLPLMVSVSRKSFLGSLTGRAVEERGPASLAAEIYAALQGVDYIRTHDAAALRDALVVLEALGALGRERSGA